MADKAASDALDVQAAHRAFSAACFNKTWEYIDKTERTPAEEEAMLRLTMASHWHWTQREDCAPENLSVACWQVSRVFSLLGQAENARRYGQRSLEALGDRNDLPFFSGFAYEALARAEAAAGDQARMQDYLDRARTLADEIQDEESKQILLSDLESIGA